MSRSLVKPSQMLVAVAIALACLWPQQLRCDSVPELILQEGHRGDEAHVTTAAFSTDGRLLLTAGAYDFNAVLWNVDSGRQIRAFRGHELFVTTVDIAPDSRWAVTASQDRTVRLWDTHSGIQVASVDVGFAVAAVKVSPSGLQTVAAGSSKLAKIFATAGLKELGVLELDQGDITSISFSPSAPAVALSGDGEVALFSLATRKPLWHCDLPAGSTSRLQFSPDGSMLYGLGSDNSVRVWAAHTGVLICSWSVSNPIAISADGREVVGLDGNNHNVLIDTETGQTIRRYLRNLATYAVFSPDRSRFVGTNLSGLRLYNTDSGDVVQHFSSSTTRVMGASLSRNGRYLATGGGFIRLWDLEAGQQVETFGGLRRNVMAVSLSPDGKEMLTGSIDGDIRYWLEGHEVLVNPIRMRSEIKSIEHSPNGRHWLVQTYYDDAVLIKHDSYGNLDGAVTFHGSAGYAAAVSRVGDRVVTSYDRTNAMVWNATTGAPVRMLRHPDPTAEVRAAAFSKDGRYVVTGSYDGRARLWLVKTGQLVSTFAKHLSPITAIAISDDNKFILTGSGTMSGGDDSVRLWSVRSHKELLRLTGHSAGIHYVGFLPHKMVLVSASEDGSVKLWNQKTGRELCSLFSLANEHWIVTTPDGKFDTDSLDDLRIGQMFFDESPLLPISLERFLTSKYEPRLLARLLAGETFGSSPLSRGVGPQYGAEISRITREPVSDTATVTVRVAVEGKDDLTSDQGDQLADVRMFRDGQLIAIQSAAQAQPLVSSGSRVGLDGATKISGGRAFVFDGIKLPAGRDARRVTFSCYALNKQSIKGQTTRRVELFPPSTQEVRRTAYIITIGIGDYREAIWNLSWASADARTMKVTLTQLMESSRLYDRVVSVALTSEHHSLSPRPTKQLLASVFKTLAGDKTAARELLGVEHSAELETPLPQDLLLVSFSGHGYRTGDGRYFIVPYDAEWSLDQEALNGSSISTDELEEWLRPIDAGGMALILDACHSGAAFQSPGFKPGPMGSRGLGQLAYDKGMQILAATQPDSVAIEGSLLKMGLLSYVLGKEALEHASHEHAVDDMSLRQWFDYAAERVPALYRGEVGRDRRNGRHRHGGAKRDALVVQTSENSKDRSEIQRPAIFDYSPRSRKLIVIPGFRTDYRVTGEATLAEAIATERRGGKQDLEQSLAKYEEAENWFREVEDDYALAHALEATAAALVRRGDIEKAIEKLEEAAFLYERAVAPSARAHTLANLGYAQYSQRNPAIALAQLEAALQLARQEGDHELTLTLLNKIADIYSNAGERMIADAYHKQASESLDR